MQKRTTGRQKLIFAVASMALLLWTTVASAQAEETAPSLSGMVKAVVRDPATYAPFVVKYGAMNLDWESSQIFFQHGFVEHNAHFTVTGRSNDTAMSHSAGSRKIARDSLMLLAQTMPENLAVRSIERVLIRRYPQHRKMLLVAGRVGRIVGSSYLSYSSSIGHIRQWRRNERLARQMGYP